MLWAFGLFLQKKLSVYQSSFPSTRTEIKPGSPHRSERRSLSIRLIALQQSSLAEQSIAGERKTLKFLGLWCLMPVHARPAATRSFHCRWQTAWAGTSRLTQYVTKIKAKAAPDYNPGDNSMRGKNSGMERQVFTSTAFQQQRGPLHFKHKL